MEIIVQFLVWGDPKKITRYGYKVQTGVPIAEGQQMHHAIPRHGMHACMRNENLDMTVMIITLIDQ